MGDCRCNRCALSDGMEKNVKLRITAMVVVLLLLSFSSSPAMAQKIRAASGDVADRVDATKHLLPVPVAGVGGGVPVVADGRVWAGLGVAGPSPADAHDLAVTALMTTA